jgi:porin
MPKLPAKSTRVREENGDGRGSSTEVAVMRNKEEFPSTGCADIRQAKGIKRIFCLVVLSLFCSVFRISAQTSSDVSDDRPRQYLFGDWGGERSSLASKGVTFDFFYVSDLQANPVGGLEQTQAGWGRIRGTMDIDFGKLTDWNGLTFHATGLWQFGGNLGADIGTLANPSGLVSAHTTRLDSFWLQQALLHNRLFVRVGQFAGLDFYGNQEYGASYLIEPLDYALGNLFPTTYESFDPAATPAVQIQLFPWRTLYIKSAVLAGNRNPYQQDPTGFNFQIRNIPVFVYEIGFTHDEEALAGQKSYLDQKTYPGSYKFGAAYNGGKFTNAAGIQSNGNYLIYGMANQALYRSDAGSSTGLDATIGFDWSPGDLNRENSQITAGVRYNGPIPSRPQDGVAFGFVYTRISDPFQSVGIPFGMPPLGSEKALEVNYAAKLTRYFLVQPVFQYYEDVGGNSRIPNATVFGFRTKINF